MFIVDEVKRAAMEVDEVMSVSEVQVYYKDSGGIACKVDIVLPPSLTIPRRLSPLGEPRGARRPRRADGRREDAPCGASGD